MPEDVKNIRYAALAAAAGLVLTGCGNESNSGSNPSAPVTSTPSGTPSGSPAAGALPLIVTRTGGFAGFDDRVTLGTDGVASVVKNGKGPVRCKVDSGLLTTITTAIQQVDWSRIATTKPTIRHPDDMVIAIAAGGRQARLEDPKVKPLADPVSKLLSEATVPPGKLCKPV
ncbi:MAG TPA: hypothetical protein VGD34_18770 [Kribbella sp.]|jgi:hypothetical protein